MGWRPTSAEGGCSASATSRTATPDTATATSTWTAPGRIFFGVRAQNNSTRTVNSAAAYNNNQWHQVTATMSSAGMRLYVDGVLVGSRTDTTEGEAYLGYWRLGGDNLGGWPSTPPTRNFIGSVDEVAIYPSALTAAQVQAQYVLGADRRRGWRQPVTDRRVHVVDLGAHGVGERLRVQRPRRVDHELGLDLR